MLGMMLILGHGCSGACGALGAASGHRPHPAPHHRSIILHQDHTQQSFPAPGSGAAGSPGGIRYPAGASERSRCRRKPASPRPPARGAWPRIRGAVCLPGERGRAATRDFRVASCPEQPRSGVIGSIGPPSAGSAPRRSPPAPPLPKKLWLY